MPKRLPPEQTELGNQILHVVRQNPGSNATEVTHIVGAKYPTVRKYLYLLQGVGLIRLEAQKWYPIAMLNPTVLPSLSHQG